MATPDQSSSSLLSRTILVTDSGLGGLSVFNAIANRLEQGSPWQRVNLIYFNAWPAPHRGYNHFDTQERRGRVFNNALYAMSGFDPDLILIACNTLSVIYPQTHFAGTSDMRVEGIVDHGVEMVCENLAADPDSRVVILGTPTTIKAKSHEKELIRRGISQDRIVTIGCTNLAGWIEREPFSGTVNEMIRNFVQEAAAKLEGFDGNIIAVLCCTHFGYRQSLFEKAFVEFVSGKVTILDPNIRMAQQIFSSIDKSGVYAAQTEVQIVSQAVWTDEQVGAYLKLLKDMTPATRYALKHYRHVPRLFSVE